MRARYQPQSFIKNTELIDERFLDINILPRVAPTFNDEEYVIESEYDQRPDLLAWRLYNSPNLFWVFAMRNPDILLDPIRDFTSGTSIILPSAGVVRSLENSSRALTNNA